jgi:hypothetical protein
MCCVRCCMHDSGLVLISICLWALCTRELHSRLGHITCCNTLVHIVVRYTRALTSERLHSNTCTPAHHDALPHELYSNPALSRRTSQKLLPERLQMPTRTLPHRLELRVQHPSESCLPCPRPAAYTATSASASALTALPRQATTLQLCHLRQLRPLPNCPLPAAD